MRKFERHLPAVLIAILFLTPLVPGDSASHISGLRVLVVWGAALALFALGITQRIKPLFDWWDIAAVGLIGWAVISFFFTLRTAGCGANRAGGGTAAGGCVVLYLGVRVLSSRDGNCEKCGW